MAFIKVEAVVKQFQGRETPVLSGLELEIREGEVVALAGSSGSGKTTLLRVIAGLEEPEAGRILFRNKKVPGPTEKLIAGHDSIRLVHQHFELAHRRTVYENISQKLRHLHPSEQKERTRELIQVCRLGYVATEYVEELSGGEKQRLALARTLAEEPELLLLDEPFSNLDPHLKEEIRYDLFSFIREKRLTVIMVSHDPKDALSLADRILVLQEGKLVQSGAPKEIYYRPASPAVAALFGRINICKSGALFPFAEGDLLKYLRKVPSDALLGFRPELLCIVPSEEAHFQVKADQLFFHGPSSELKVTVGEEISFYLQLPTLYGIPEDKKISLQINLDYLQTWNPLTHLMSVEGR